MATSGGFINNNREDRMKERRTFPLVPFAFRQQRAFRPQSDAHRAPFGTRKRIIATWDDGEEQKKKKNFRAPLSSACVFHRGRQYQSTSFGSFVHRTVFGRGSAVIRADGWRLSGLAFCSALSLRRYALVAV